MGNADFMQSQIEEKLAKGFDCIKLKIGVDWKSEKKSSKTQRKIPKEQLELRVDANGAFSYEEARMVLQELADLGIHSIEQPIKKSKSEVRKKKTEKNSTDCRAPWNEMAKIMCRNTYSYCFR